MLTKPPEVGFVLRSVTVEVEFILTRDEIAKPDGLARREFGCFHFQCLEGPGCHHRVGLPGESDAVVGVPGVVLLREPCREEVDDVEASIVAIPYEGPDGSGAI